MNKIILACGRAGPDHYRQVGVPLGVHACAKGFWIGLRVA